MGKLDGGKINPKKDYGRRYFVNGNCVIVYNPNSAYPRYLYRTDGKGYYCGMSFGSNTGFAASYNIKGDICTLYVPDERVYTEVLTLPKELYETPDFVYNEDCMDDLAGASYDDYANFRAANYELIPGKGLKKKGAEFTLDEEENGVPVEAGDFLLYIKDDGPMGDVFPGSNFVWDVPMAKDAREFVKPDFVFPMEVARIRAHHAEDNTGPRGLVLRELKEIPSDFPAGCVLAYVYAKNEVAELSEA